MSKIKNSLDNFEEISHYRKFVSKMKDRTIEKYLK